MRALTSSFPVTKTFVFSLSSLIRTGFASGDRLFRLLETTKRELCFPCCATSRRALACARMLCRGARGEMGSPAFAVCCCCLCGGACVLWTLRVPPLFQWLVRVYACVMAMPCAPFLPRRVGVSLSVPVVVSFDSGNGCVLHVSLSSSHLLLFAQRRLRPCTQLRPPPSVDAQHTTRHVKTLKHFLFISTSVH